MIVWSILFVGPKKRILCLESHTGSGGTRPLTYECPTMLEKHWIQPGEPRRFRVCFASDCTCTVFNLTALKRKQKKCTEFVLGTPSKVWVYWVYIQKAYKSRSELGLCQECLERPAALSLCWEQGHKCQICIKNKNKKKVRLYCVSAGWATKTRRALHFIYGCPKKTEVNVFCLIWFKKRIKKSNCSEERP